MPSGSVPNYFFKGSSDLRFQNKKKEWTTNRPTLSNGAVSVDLDNDGDLDLVVNNFNENASILENTLELEENHYLKIKLKGSEQNPFGIGTKVSLYSGGKKHFQQLHLTRGFLSSAVPEFHFGLGSSNIDSVAVIFPDEKVIRIQDVAPNKTVEFSYKNAKKNETKSLKLIPQTFENINLSGLTHVHKEAYFPEFAREKLMPYGITQEGPALAVADINQDGREDIFIGGSKGIPGIMYIASLEGFKKTNEGLFNLDRKSEDVDAIFTDIDTDGDLDLFVVSGGGEYYNNVSQCMDRIYINDGLGNFSKSENTLPVYYHNGSVVKNNDIDDDGDLDYFVGSKSIPNAFGKYPRSFLLKNNNGKLSPIQDDLFQDTGMVNDAVFMDYDSDGDADLFIVAEWSKIRLFENKAGIYKEVTEDVIQENPKGLWQAALPYDVDGDGDLDLVVGNVGLNTKFKASAEFPMKMYRHDFDQNGKEETIVSVAKNGVYYPIDSKNKLAGQLESLIKKKYKTAAEFGGESMTDIFEKKALSLAVEETIEELQSGYYNNVDGKFSYVPFETAFQWGPISGIKEIEYAHKKMLIIVGSKIDLPPYQGLWNSQEHFVFFFLERI